MEVNCLTLKDLISPRQTRLDFAIEDAENAQKVSTNKYFIVSSMFWMVMPSFRLVYSIIVMAVIEEFLENGAIATFVSAPLKSLVLEPASEAKGAFWMQ
jgi:hypothetical protein